MRLHQTKKLLQSEGNYQQMKRPPTEREKVPVNDISNKGLKQKTKNSYKSISKIKNKNQLKTGQKS